MLDVGINFISLQEGREGEEEVREAGSGRREGVNRGKKMVEVNPEDEKEGLRLVGDVDLESLMGHAGAVSPVPGGIGPMTVAMLMENTLNNFLRQHKNRG